MTEPVAVSAPAAAAIQLANRSRIGPLSGAIATNLPAALSLFAGVAATVWAGLLLVGRAEGLSAPPYDLAFFQQVIWNIGHSGAWVSSFHVGSFLGLHFSPVLVIPAVVERLFAADVRVLNVMHAIVIGALAPAAFLFLRAAFRPSRAAGALAAGLAIPIPIWGATQDVIRSDFHPEAAGVVLALLAGWAGLAGRRPAMWALACLALAAREDMAYAVAVVGLVVALRGRGDVAGNGWVVAAFAGIWALVVFGVAMPWLRDGAASETSRYYAWLGGGLGVVVAPFTMTDRVVGALGRPAAWFVLAGMAASLLWLPLLRPRWALLVVPPLVAILLSAHWFQAAARLQYSLILVVPLMAAAGFGGRRAIAVADRLSRRLRGRQALARSGRRTARPDAVARNLLLVLVAAAPGVLGAWVQGSLPPFDGGDPAFFRQPASIDRVKRIADRVPPSALLLADEGLVAPLAGRSAVGRFAATVTRDDAYVLVDRMAWEPTSQIGRRHDENIARLESSARPILYEDARFVLWGPAPGGGSP